MRLKKKEAFNCRNIDVQTLHTHGVIKPSLECILSVCVCVCVARSEIIISPLEPSHQLQLLPKGSQRPQSVRAPQHQALAAIRQRLSSFSVCATPLFNPPCRGKNMMRLGEPLAKRSFSRLSGKPVIYINDMGSRSSILPGEKV